MSDFLPADYEVPAAEGNYFKFKKGTNTFRVMGSAIVGYEYWNTSNKPVRAKKMWDAIPSDARLEDGQFKPKHFWAFVVFNYDAKRVQIMEVTQKSIMSAMEALVHNPKWGDPKGYDITVTRTGDGLDTEYSVMPEPHSPAPDTSVPTIRLEALFDGSDPFSPEQKVEEVKPGDDPFSGVAF